MTILIDYRQGSAQLATHPLLASCCELCDLDTRGDIFFTGKGPDNCDLNIGIEMKAFPELISSLKTKRLQGFQIPNMLQANDINMLAYYGSFRPHPTRGCIQTLRNGKGGSKYWSDFKPGITSQPIPYSYLMGQLRTLTLAGVTIERFPTLDELAMWVLTEYHYWQRDYSSHRSLSQAIYKSPLNTNPVTAITNPDPPDLTRRIRVAVELTHPSGGIGYSKAKAIAKQFPTVRAMVNSTEAELLQVPGVGKVLARNIVKGCTT